MPSFYTRTSGYRAPHHARTPAEAAELLRAHTSLQLQNGIVFGPFSLSVCMYVCLCREKGWAPAVPRKLTAETVCMGMCHVAASLVDDVYINTVVVVLVVGVRACVYVCVCVRG
jgi:hypothetical protein